MAALEDLVALYTGEPDDDGGWWSEPYPTVPLAVEICRHVRPEGLIELVHTVYGGDLPDEMMIEGGEVYMLRLGFQHWWQTGRRAEVAV